MNYILSVLVALVAMVGLVSAEDYSVNEAYQSGSNYANVYIGGGYGGYYGHYYPYGGYGGTNVVGSPITIIQSVNQAQAVAQSQGGVDGANDDVPASDTSSKASVAPVLPTAPNGMTIVSDGTYIQDEFVLANVPPVPYVEYQGYGAVVVEQKGMSADAMAKVAGVFFNSTELDVNIVYFEQGVSYLSDGRIIPGKLDLSSPPRVARAFAML